MTVFAFELEQILLSGIFVIITEIKPLCCDK